MGKVLQRNKKFRKEKKVQVRVSEKNSNQDISRHVRNMLMLTHSNEIGLESYGLDLNIETLTKNPLTAYKGCLKILEMYRDSIIATSVIRHSFQRALMSIIKVNDEILNKEMENIPDELEENNFNKIIDFRISERIYDIIQEILKRYKISMSEYIRFRIWVESICTDKLRNSLVPQVEPLLGKNLIKYKKYREYLKDFLNETIDNNRDLDNKINRIKEAIDIIEKENSDYSGRLEKFETKERDILKKQINKVQSYIEKKGR